HCVVMTGKYAQFLPGFDVPQADRAAGGSGSDVPPVRADGDTGDRLGRPVECAYQAAIAHVPQAKCAIGSAGDGDRAIGAEGDAGHTSLMTGNVIHRAAAVDIPQPQRTIFQTAERDNTGWPRTESNSDRGAFYVIPFPDKPARRRVPNTRARIAKRCSNQPAAC